MSEPSTSGAPDTAPTYEAFHRYFTFRTDVLGLQDGSGTVVGRTVSHELRGAASVLDAGCGRGLHLIPLVARGKCVVGLDFCESNVALLAQHGYEAHVCDCVREIPARFHGADAVVCAEFLEHLHPPEAARLLGNIRDALRDGGRLLVTVPYREALAQNVVVCPYCTRSFHRHGHVRTYDVETLRAQVEAAGLRYVRHHVVPEKRLKKLGIYRFLPFELYLRHNRRKHRRQGRLIAVFAK